MSGTLSNYNGRQPDNIQGIKQFTSSISGLALWMYKKIQTQTFITPADQSKDVYIAKDLYVIGSLNNPSDARLKENIESINEQEYNSILKITPVKYSYISDESKKTHYGVLAQEVETCLPELVSSIENIVDANSTHIKTVNYIELIPLLIRKIQEMQNDIDSLNKKLSSVYT
jgi:hypothetical protein